MLKVGELRNLSPEELREKENAMRKELMQLRFQSKTGKLERQGAVKETRRTIARILTVLNEESGSENNVAIAKPSKKKSDVGAGLKPDPTVKSAAKKVKAPMKKGKS